MGPPLDLSVYLVTDTRMCGRFGVVPTVIDAVSAGVTAVQLRDPQSSDEEFVALGTQLRKSLDGTGVPLLVNDRVHLAAEMGASGAHVGQGDVHPLSARTCSAQTRTSASRCRQWTTSTRRCSCLPAPWTTPAWARCGGSPPSRMPVSPARLRHSLTSSGGARGRASRSVESTPRVRPPFAAPVQPAWRWSAPSAADPTPPQRPATYATPGSAHDTSTRGTHDRGQRPERRCRRPGRPQDLLSARRLRDDGPHRAHGAKAPAA